MILRPLQPAEPFFRVLTPRWAIAPKSGAGSAQKGGRFNRPGLHAIYFSDSVETATAEYRQDEILMPPGTLVTYRIALRSLIDFSQGYVTGAWDSLWDEWNCDWRNLAFNQRIEPPSWVLGDLAIEEHAQAILFPSVRRAGGLNLVVFTQTLTSTDELEPFDPHSDLPQNQDSWKDRAP